MRSLRRWARAAWLIYVLLTSVPAAADKPSAGGTGEWSIRARCSFPGVSSPAELAPTADRLGVELRASSGIILRAAAALDAPQPTLVGCWALPSLPVLATRPDVTSRIEPKGAGLTIRLSSAAWSGSVHLQPGSGGNEGDKDDSGGRPLSIAIEAEGSTSASPLSLRQTIRLHSVSLATVPSDSYRAWLEALGEVEVRFPGLLAAIESTEAALEANLAVGPRHDWTGTGALLAPYRALALARDPGSLPYSRPILVEGTEGAVFRVELIGAGSVKVMAGEAVLCLDKSCDLSLAPAR